MDKRKVVVGLSGGVDSSVAALLLKKQGYEVVGLHMKSSEEDNNSAFEISRQLGIDFQTMEYSNEMDIVKKYFIDEYTSGRTPNPCVVCNREVKFKPFIEYANNVNADFFATGHYAKTERKDRKTYLVRAKDNEKDQTYFLNQLSQSQLEKAIFPIGDLLKQDLRKIAEENNLSTAHKKDSFDLCFVGNEKFKDFMKQNYPQKSGKIIDIDSNKQVGKHDGLNQFTIGQRKGLNVGGQKDILGKWFVVKKDLENNILYVSTKEEYLFSKTLIAKNFNWIPQKPLKQEFDCTAKIRYRQEDQECHVIILDDTTIKVEFKEKQRAINLGQYCVLYDGKYCLGGGVIEEVE